MESGFPAKKAKPLSTEASAQSSSSAASAKKPKVVKKLAPFKWSDIEKHVLEEEETLDDDGKTPLSKEKLFDLKIIGCIYYAIMSKRLKFFVGLDVAENFVHDLKEEECLFQMNGQTFCTFDEIWHPLRELVKARVKNENDATVYGCKWKYGVMDFYLKLEKDIMTLCSRNER